VIGRMTTAGAMQFFPLPLPSGAKPGWSVGARALTIGPTGVMWATVPPQDPMGPGSASSVVAIQLTGVMTTVASLPGTGCILDCTILSAQDGNAWTSAPNGILRISPAGTLTSDTVVAKRGNAGTNSVAIGPTGTSGSPTAPLATSACSPCPVARRSPRPRPAWSAATATRRPPAARSSRSPHGPADRQRISRASASRAGAPWRSCGRSAYAPAPPAPSQ